MDDGTYEFENRKYVDPNVGVNETNQFIDNFRQTQQEHSNQVAQETRDLGSDVPINQGGLDGTSLWESRYAAAPNEALVADLKATAQSQALSDSLSNIQKQMANRYNVAYRNYYRRKEDESRRAKAAAAAAKNKKTTTSGNTTTGGVNLNSTGGGGTNTVTPNNVNTSGGDTSAYDNSTTSWWNDGASQLDALHNDYRGHSIFEW